MAEKAIFPNFACRAAIIGLPNIHEDNRSFLILYLTFRASQAYNI